MTPKVLFAASAEDWQNYEAPLTAALAEMGVDADLRTGFDHPAEVDYIVYAPSSSLTDFAPFTSAKAVLNLWAGVEDVVGNQSLTQPLARMVDPGLSEGMVEWVTGHVLRHHLGMDTHVLGQDGEWRHDSVPPLARHRSVTILGLGELGVACAQALARLGFPVTGWSRGAKSLPGITCLNGEATLAHALGAGQITVLLLPLTPDTRDLLDAERLAQLPPGAVLINPGRGPLIDDDALLKALRDGRLAHATLDVFREEPLAKAHPFWSDPRVTVTPHIASATRPETASRSVAENIRRGETGEPFLHLVDRARGY